MAFHFTDEQIALRDLARNFFEKEVRPVMAELDASVNPKDCYPYELVRKMSALGLKTLPLPEEYGGVEADEVTRTLVFTTMCETEIGTAKIMSQCWKVTRPIVKAGTEAQKKKFLTEFANDPDYTCSVCSTEPDSGSDNVAPYSAPPGQGWALTAVPQGDTFILNGTKEMISLSGFSKLLLVYARTDRSKPSRQGMTVFLVPSDLPGISFGSVYNKLGWRLYPNGSIFFDNVRVPKEYMLGELNAGAATASKMTRGDLETPCQILGLCKSIYRIALDHARKRVQGGKPIIEHQSVGAMLSELALLVDVQEAYLYDIANSAKMDQNFDRKKTRFGTIFSRDCVIRAIVLGLDITASGGIMKDHPMEKLVRDGLTLLHGGGTNSILKIRIVPWLQ